MHDWHRREGSPFPLGATWIPADKAYNFALYSKHAEMVELRLYRPDDLHSPEFTFEFDPLLNKSGPIWHCRVPQDQVDGARYYGYRIDGPRPSAGEELLHAADAQQRDSDVPYG